MKLPTLRSNSRCGKVSGGDLKALKSASRQPGVLRVSGPAIVSRCHNHRELGCPVSEFLFPLSGPSASHANPPTEGARSRTCICKTGRPKPSASAWRG